MRNFLQLKSRLLLSLGVAVLSLSEPGAEPSRETVDPSTLSGKVMCGYQGWFNCEGDGADLGWTHWARQRNKAFGPGNVTVDLWPDVSELDAGERYPTGFRLADGSPAEVFSSFNRRTVIRHFQWMKDYGIDGAFVQRFANGLSNDPTRNHRDAVLAHAREGARKAGRAYALMYDLSGLKAGQTAVVKDDWKRLRSTLELTRDSGYLHHEGKPVLAVWGIGFSDDRDYSLAECRELIEFLKEDGCTVMLGVPSWWREGTRDAIDDPELQAVLELADILSPWTIGRYRDLKGVERHSREVWQPDLEWCREREMEFLPVIYPGFSWHNLHGGDLDDIPRQKGEFLWSQFVAAKRIGCEMIYVAMFDEVDEGTAIFKCTSEVPVGEGVSFLTWEGLPSDHYLRLTGEGGKLLRGEIPPSEVLPDLPAPSE